MIFNLSIGRKSRSFAISVFACLSMFAMFLNPLQAQTADAPPDPAQLTRISGPVVRGEGVMVMGSRRMRTQADGAISTPRLAINWLICRAIQFTTELPMTSSGKIMRRLLTDIDDGTRATASDLTPTAT